MKTIYKNAVAKTLLAALTVLFSSIFNNVVSQTATVSMPVGLGSPNNVSFGSLANDSIKIFGYNATTNVLTHRSLCKPVLLDPPGFTDALTGITYNPFDGNYYLQRIANTGGIWNTHIFRWNPTTCPGPTLSPYATFLNQFVVGLEFDPATGLAYQLNFVDTTGVPAAVVDAPNNVGQYTSSAWLTINVPAVAYFDATNGDLRYARAKDPDGADWHPSIAVATAGSVGSFLSMTIVNGNPAISYYDAINGNLMYVSATNANGTVWGVPVTVEATNNIGQFTSLKVVNGNPAIAYYDVTNGDLRYIRSVDISGAAWGVPVAVSTANNVGQHTSLEIVNGNPAISFYDVTNGNLMYARSTDANGAAWGAVTVEATNNVGQFTSLKVVNGNPAISYFDVTNNDLRYIRANDATGTGWGAPVAVSTSGIAGQYNSLFVVNGNPAISYYDGTNGDLKYKRATDANGATWGAEVTTEATGVTGQFTSMMMVNGHPAITYYDVSNANAKYIRSYDANGNMWYRATGVYNMHLQRINFVTGLIEQSKKINYGGRNIYRQSGDLVLTPDGKYLGIFDNKYFSINWRDYNSGALVATHIDTIVLPPTTPQSSVSGLAYSDGKLVASVTTPTRLTNNYREVDIITGAMSPITYNAGTVLFTSADMTNIPTGVGAAKKLTSATLVSPGTYDLVYDIVVRNYGGNPISNVQVYDTLSNINGAGNVVSRSITGFSAPAGFTLNPAYTGTTAPQMRLLSIAPNSLSNIPGQNEIRIQITVRVQNLLAGVVYNNQATVTATNIFGDALRDLSTDGDNPDRNNNAKPDDLGESQPTPFVIQLVGSTDPCVSITKVLFSQNFATAASATVNSKDLPVPVLGTGVTAPIQQTEYRGVTAQPLDIDQFTLTADANNANTGRFVNLQDNTPADVNGQMMVVNADAANKIIYRGGFTFPMCANQQYSLSFYGAFVGNPAYSTICGALNSSGQFVYPDIKIRIRDGVTNAIITEVNTGNIAVTSWRQYGVKFVSPASYTSLIFELINDAPGGCGNDFAIDDIQFGSCDPVLSVVVGTTSGCIGGTVDFTSVINDPGAIPGPKEYQWQVATSATGPWVNISGATATVYTINPITLADVGKFYRLILAAAGNIANPNCIYPSAPIELLGTTPSTDPTGITTSASTICNGTSVTLTATGGTLGTGANYQWGTGAVVGANPIVGATSATLVVTPTTTTTYWVRIENTAGPCAATTSGVTTVITVNQPSTAPTSITTGSICNGSSITLTANGGVLGTGATYQWGTGATVGSSIIGTTAVPTLSVNPTTTTTYWVRIIGTTAPCTANTSGVTGVVNVSNPSTAPTGITTGTICNGSSILLTATGGVLGTSATYEWGTGATVGSSVIGTTAVPTLTVSPTTTTTYWVRIIGTTAPCAATTTGVTGVVTVNNPSTAPTSITTGSICNGSSITLTANGGVLGTGATYQWGTGATVGSSIIGTTAVPTLSVNPTTTTTYWVRIIGTTAPCTANTSGVTAVVTVSNPSTQVTSVNGGTICNGGSILLTATGGVLGTSATYEWGTGAVIGSNVIAGSTASITVSPTSTTTYWVRIVGATAPCTAPAGGVTNVVTVNNPSTAPTSLNGGTICSGSSILLTASGGTLGTGATYEWGTGAVIGSNIIAGATTSTYSASPTSTTTYWVRIVGTAAPCSNPAGSVTSVVTVNSLSVSPTSANTNKVNICPGITAQLSITGGSLGTGATWRWYTGSAGGTLVGTGATLNVTPTVTTTYYLRGEGTCNNTAVQSVTVTVNCDIDKDNDGIPDFVESAIPASFTDANSNGIINAYDPTYAGFVDNNGDYLNDNFQADGDSDNDGILNYLDATFAGRVDVNSDGVDDRFDLDRDGIINMLDLDSDNDGIMDVAEAWGVDTNGDGRIDSYTDTDNDGLSDNVDTRINMTNGAYNTGIGLTLINIDGDGFANFLDLDSDNDGIPDVREVFGADANNNGIIDGFVDANNDGVHDSYINATALLLTGADGTSDGRADSWPNKNLDRDLRPNAYDLDSDGDGIVDAIEAGGGILDLNTDGFADGSTTSKGWSSSVWGMPTLTLANSEGVGNPNYLDIDTDEDGIPDNIEGQSTASYRIPLGTDTDGDGLQAPYDNLVGFGGSGIFLYDHDGDGTPDVRDLDTDSDGASDLCEGNDWNFNGVCEEPLILTGLDDDGDGLDNLFDSLTSVISLKGTSYMMGNLGSLTGDAAPGTRATVQKRTVAQSDRDWRWAATVLPVNFLGFSGNLQNTNVNLYWIITTSKEIDRFEVERSTDNASFIKVGTVSDKVNLNVQQSYGLLDDISNSNSDIFYYRLKAIGKDGSFKYSNVLVVKRSNTKTPLTVTPNPAIDVATVKFFVEKETLITVRLLDNTGKTVLLEKIRAAKGANAYQLTGLLRFANGVYSVQVLINDELTTQKLVIAH
jgi:hypothetical protein